MEDEARSAEPDPEVRVRPNGVLKRHLSPAVAYRDCMKNHAASLGGYAVDGCGEFMQSPTATSSDPASLKCAACGCHRNFHRREVDDPVLGLDYQPRHRTRPRTPEYPSAPHMLLALSSENPNSAPPGTISRPGQDPSCRKRFRSKFSTSQKERMLDFAERVGWKMQRRDDEMVSRFCSEVGVDRGVLKVWMHNNKNTFFKRVENSDPPVPGSDVIPGCFSSRPEDDG